MSNKTVKKYPAFLVTVTGGGGTQKIGDWVAVEGSYDLYLNDTLVDTIVLSPADCEAHALGFVVTEGLVVPGDVEEVRQEGRRVFVRTVTKMDITQFKALWRSSAYRGSEEGPIPAVSSRMKVDTALIVQCARQISEQAENWKKTGGLHISLLFDGEGKLIKAAEDIGRHNCVDKVVGYAILHQLPLSETILACSGRQPEGMVLKAARARIPIIITKAAVTDSGIEAAERLGVTIIGFARGDRFTIYSHPERIHGASP